MRISRLNPSATPCGASSPSGSAARSPTPWWSAETAPAESYDRPRDAESPGGVSSGAEPAGSLSAPRGREPGRRDGDGARNATEPAPRCRSGLCTERVRSRGSFRHPPVEGGLLAPEQGADLRHVHAVGAQLPGCPRLLIADRGRPADLLAVRRCHGKPVLDTL